METRDLTGSRVINERLSLTHSVESGEYEREAKADKENIVVPDKSLLLFLRPLSSSSLLHFQTNSIN